VIHAFALEPQLVAGWGRQSEYRFMRGAFGLGAPRVLLALPKFNKWKRDVLRATEALSLTAIELKRIQELLSLFQAHNCRRVDAVYDGLLTWLENAEREYDRKNFKGIIASANPREHRGVLVSEGLEPGDLRWDCPRGASPARTPEALAAVLTPMLLNCRVLHLVDPYFGKHGHRKVLTKLMQVIADNEIVLDEVKVHCAARGATCSYFEEEVAKMIPHLSENTTVSFVRWEERAGRDKLHNRYVLTDLGGIALGIGLDSGDTGQTDDLLLLPREQYQHRWKQYVMDDGTFEKFDTPAPIRGRRPSGGQRRNRRSPHR